MLHIVCHNPINMDPKVGPTWVAILEPKCKAPSPPTLVHFSRCVTIPDVLIIIARSQR